MNIEKIYSQSWQVFAKHWQFIIIVGIGTSILTAVVNALAKSISSDPSVGKWLGIAINLVISNIIALGWIKNYLAMGRGAEPDLGHFTAAAPKLLKYLAGTVTLGLMVIAGLLCFVFPGIYLAIKYQFVPTLLTDKEVGIGDAFRLGAQMTDGAMTGLTLLLLINLGLMLVGFITFGIGLIVAVPIATIAGTIAYLELEPKLAPRS